MGVVGGLRWSSTLTEAKGEGWLDGGGGSGGVIWRKKLRPSPSSDLGPVLTLSMMCVTLVKK